MGSHFAERNNFQLQHTLRAFRLAAAIVADSIALQLRTLLMAGSRCHFAQCSAPFCYAMLLSRRFACSNHRLNHHEIPARALRPPTRARTELAGSQQSRRKLQGLLGGWCMRQRKHSIPGCAAWLLQLAACARNGGPTHPTT